MNLPLEHAITLEELTPAWLTEVLRRHGVLSDGKVVAIEKQPTSAFNSHTLHLEVTYSEAALATAPVRLLLKCNIPAEWAMRAGAREVAFYNKVADLPDHPAVLVRCFDAVHDSRSGNSHILLEDLSSTHVVAVDRSKQIALVDNLPSAKHLEQSVDALARFHAYWWEHPQLGSGIAPVAWGCVDEATFVAEIARRRRAWDHFLTHQGDWFPTHLQSMVEHILADDASLAEVHADKGSYVF